MPEGKLSKKEFYDKYYPIVKDSVEGTGLFPETVIAQMAIESGWGGSGLSTKHNNFFGIKGDKGRGVSMGTEEEVDGKRENTKANFRVYNSVEDSVKDYVSLLKNNDKYAKVFEAKTPEEQAELIGQTPYSTSSNYGDSIKQTVMANKDKTKTTGDKNSFDKRANDFINIKKSEVDYLKQKYESSSGDKKADYNKQYLTAKKKLDDYVAGYVAKKQKEIESDLDKREEDARKNKRFVEAGEIDLKRQEYEKTKVDFGETKQVSPFSREYGKDTPGEKVIDKNVFGQKITTIPDLDYDKVYSQFENFKQQQQQEVEEVKQEKKRYDLDVDLTDGQGGGGGSSSATTAITAIEDRPDRIQRSGSPANVDDYKKGLQDYEEELGQLQKEEQDLLELEKYDFQPSEKTKHDNDAIGSLIDVSRGIMGTIGANEEVPTYERGEMFSEAMGDAFDRRDQGLTPEEMSFRERQGEETYAYDIKNISRASGGSAGVFLGNMGSAAKRLYADKAGMSNQNEAVRRMNRENFQNMSLRDEQINRQIFQDDLNQVMMTKQAGAGLVQDAFTNIKERSDYNKQYGKGSVYDRYMDAKISDTEESRYSRDFANKQRMKSLLFENKTKQDKTKKLLENSQVLDASSNKKKKINKTKEEIEEEEMFDSLYDNYPRL